jgi:hypothetical protein
MEHGHPPIQINNEQPEVVVVDNFLENPMEHREFALRLNYFKKGSYGVRSGAAYPYPEYKEAFEKLLNRKITRWEEGVNGCYQWCDKHQEIVYHVDAQDYAAILYLTPDAPHDSGTTLWKSKHSGVRYMGPGTRAHETFGPNGEYLKDSDAWELVDHIGNVFNRLVLWNGRFVHSAGGYFGETVGDSRLFQIFFFHVE